MFGPDWLANLFLFIFLFGLIFTVASLILGFVGLGGAHGGHAGGAGGHGVHMGDVGGHDIHVNLPGPHDIHIDVGGHSVQHAGQHSIGSDGPGLLNMPTMMAFITWFGGVGYILRESLGLSGYIVTPLALMSGATGAFIMFTLLARVLWPMMSKPLRDEEFRLPGTLARVVSPIRAGGVGEIVYKKQGSKYTAGAMSEDSDAIPKGAEVVIMRYEHGLAYVMDVADLRARVSDGEIESSALEQPDVPVALQSPTGTTLDEGSVRNDRQTSRR
jgi:hypothetical protein